MSRWWQKFGAETGLAFALLGALYLGSTFLNHATMREKIETRHAQLIELEQLASGQAAGGSVAVQQWLATQEEPASLIEWARNNKAGLMPTLGEIQEEMQHGVMVQAVDVTFKSVSLHEAFEFIHQAEKFSKPPWRVTSMDIDAVARGQGQVQLTFQVAYGIK